MKWRMSRERALAVAAVLALIGLALVCWSVLDPRPYPVIIAMSIAQGIGTLSLVIFLIVVVSDLRRAHVFDEAAVPAAKEPTKEPPP